MSTELRASAQHEGGGLLPARAVGVSPSLISGAHRFLTATQHQLSQFIEVRCVMLEDPTGSEGSSHSQSPCAAGVCVLNDALSWVPAAPLSLIRRKATVTYNEGLF